MIKVKWFLLVTLFIAVLTFSASADTIPLAQESAYEYLATYVLRNGDQLHCLTIGHDTDFDVEHIGDELKYTSYSYMDAVCYELKDGAFIPCQSHCADRFMENRRVVPDEEIGLNWTISGMPVSAQNETFLIDRYYAVYRWVAGEEDPWQYQCKLDMSLVPYEVIANEEYYVDGGVLYAALAEIADGGYIGEGTAFAFSLETGACQKICAMPCLYAVYPAGDNKMLILGDPVRRISGSTYLYDTVTGQTAPFAQATGVSHPVSDGRGGWYSIQKDTICHIHGDGEAEELVRIPPSNMLRSLSLSNDKKTAYYYSNGYLYIYALTADDTQENHTLTLAGSLAEYGRNIGSLPDLTDFYAEHPGAQIETIDYPSSFDEIAMELLTGSERFDILVMECSSGNLQSLLDKGFYVDLSDDERIASFVRSVYPIWREPCMHGDDIAALPVGAWNIWSFMYDRDIWEEEALGAVPTTYDEFFDALEAWNDQGILDFHPLFYDGQYSFSAFYRLLHRIMLDYMGKCTREGTPIDLHDETLLHLLSRLEDVRPILLANDARHIQGEPLIPEGSLTGIVHRFLYGDDPLRHCEPLPLGLTDAQDCSEPVFYTVLIVNPNSTQLDLAKAYLTYLAEHPTPWAQCVLLQDGPNGVREKGYEDAAERYEQLIPELNQKILAADIEDDDATVHALERQIAAITADYNERWEVLPRMTELLYQVLPHFTVLTSDGYGFLAQDGNDLMEMFASGQMDGQTFVERLDERMQMMRNEGSR